MKFIVGCLATALSTACSDGSNGPGRLTVQEACADPDDCRLREAGLIAGVNVGLA